MTLNYMEKTLKLIVSTAIFSFLLWFLISSRFYTPDQLNDARASAVELAKNGEFDKSLKQLKRLAEYEQSDIKLWADYLTVLEWDQQYSKVSEIALDLDLSDAPGYLIDSLITSVEGLYKQNETSKARALYNKLIRLEAVLATAETAEKLKSILLQYDERKLVLKKNDVKTSANVYHSQFSDYSLDQQDTNFLGFAFAHPNHYFSDQDGPVLTKSAKYDLLSLEPKSKAEYLKWADLAARRFPNVEDRLDFYSDKYAKFPNNSFINTDYITLLSWSDNHQKAWDLFSKVQNENMPIYALEALGLSARSLQKHQAAKNIYTKILSRKPNHKNGQIGLASSEIELGNKSLGIQILDKLLKVYPSDPQILSLLAYGFNQSDMTQLQKLDLYEKLKKQGVAKSGYEAAYLLDLAKIGLYEKALARVSDTQLFSAAQQLEVYALANTFKTRAALSQMDEHFDTQLVNDALSVNNQYLGFLKSYSDNETNVQEQIDFAFSDRAMLFARLNQHQSVVQLFESLKSPIQIKHYAYTSIAESYLTLKNATQALAVVNDGLTKANEIENYNLLKVGYYAALEDHQYPLAESYLKRLDKSQPQWRYSDQSTKRKLNESRDDVELMLAMDAFYRKDFDSAQQQLETLVDKVPNNSEYRVNLAQIYSSRGWFAKSYKQISMAQALDPDNSMIHILAAYNAMSLNENAVAKKYVSDLLNAPYIPNHFKSLKKSWDIHKGSTLSLSLNTNNKSGSIFSNKDFGYELAYESALLNDFWRAHVSRLSQKSRYLNQNETIDSNSVGLSYQRDWGSFSFGLKDVESHDDMAYYLKGAWRLNDDWMFDIAYHSFSKNLPVRAFASNVFADQLELSASYRPNEKYSFSASYSIEDYTDGNNRKSLAINAEQQLFVDQDHEWRLSQIANVSNSKNIPSANYFNPKRSVFLGGGLSYQGVLNHYHDRWWWHTADLSLGSVNQDGFGSNLVWEFKYQHRWQLSKRFSFYIGAGYGQSFYDGQKETGPIGLAGIEWRF